MRDRTFDDAVILISDDPRDGKLASLLWCAVESLLHYRKMRRRVWLRLGDPVAANTPTALIDMLRQVAVV